MSAKTTGALLALAIMLLSAVGSFVPTTNATYTAETIQSGGASFVNPVMQVWASDFNVFTSGAVSVNYVSSNAVTGERDFLGGLYTFAGTDNPVPSNLYQPNSTFAADGPLLTIPETLGGVAVFYNIPGVTSAHPLNLTGSIIANIYLQDIVSWNDPSILAINPYYTSSQLNYPIYPVYRTAGAGVNYQLSTFLARTSPSPTTGWNASGLGISTDIAFPSGADSLGVKETGASSASSIATVVAGQTGAIGYTDTYSATSEHLVVAPIENSAGKFVLPTVATIDEAALADASEVEADSTYSITNAPTPVGATVQSYPISTYTYLILWEDQTSQPVGYDLANFLWWVVTSGQQYGPALYYGELPAAVVRSDESLIASINYHGSPFITLASASVACAPGTVKVGLHTKCTVSVAGGVKGGVVEWSSNLAGTFSSSICTLNAKLRCSVTFTSGQAGSLSVLASYLESGGAAAFNGEATVTIDQKASRTTLVCPPFSAVIGATHTCTAAVIGYDPTGTISFSQSGSGTVTFSSATCTLAPLGGSETQSRCSVTATGATAGSVTIQASYSGDVNNGASSAHRAVSVKS